jgi:hypothetical protein
MELIFYHRMTHVKRVALKYCGGCNPGHDRVEFARRIQDAAGRRIEWVSLEDRGCDGVLLMNGCERACAETADYLKKGWRVVSIRHDKVLPEEIIALFYT